MENNTQPDTTASPYGQIISTRKLTKAVIWLSLFFILLYTPASIYSSLFPITEEIKKTDIFLFSVSFFLGIPTLLLGLIWTYKINRNSHAAGAVGMTFSPGWACFLSLFPVIDYFVMQELWKTSINPANWKNEPRSSRLMWSLITMISSILLGMFSLVIYTLILFGLEAHVALFAPFIKIIGILPTITWFISALLWLSVMPRISANQEAGRQQG